MAVRCRRSCTRMQHAGETPSMPHWLKEKAASAPSSLDAAPLRPILASAHLHGATRLLAPLHQQDKREGERERGDMRPQHDGRAPKVRAPPLQWRSPVEGVTGHSGRPRGRKGGPPSGPLQQEPWFKPDGMHGGSLGSRRWWWPPSVLGRHLVGSGKSKEAGRAAAQGEGKAGGRRNRKEEEEEEEEEKEKKRKRWE